MVKWLKGKAKALFLPFAVYPFTLSLSCAESRAVRQSALGLSLFIALSVRLKVAITANHPADQTSAHRAGSCGDGLDARSAVGCHPVRDSFIKPSVSDGLLCGKVAPGFV
jgi:hypothetical protein